MNLSISNYFDFNFLFEKIPLKFSFLGFAPRNTFSMDCKRYPRPIRLLS